MPDWVLQKNYCVAALQHRGAYNDVMRHTVSEYGEPDAVRHQAAGSPGACARFRLVGVVGVVLLVIGALAGCVNGPTSTTGSSAGAGGSTTSVTDGLLAYTKCMRTHGEPNMPEPSVSANGGHVSVNISAKPGAGFDPRSAQFTAANKTCNHLLPRSASIPNGPTITPADQADYLKAAGCMRSHGVSNFPDPTFQNNSIAFKTQTSIDTNSPQYKSALATCEKLIPAGLPYSSTNK
jgi:hypothetical protein